MVICRSTIASGVFEFFLKTCLRNVLVDKYDFQEVGMLLKGWI